MKIAAQRLQGITHLFDLVLGSKTKRDACGRIAIPIGNPHVIAFNMSPPSRTEITPLTIGNQGAAKESLLLRSNFSAPSYRKPDTDLFRAPGRAPIKMDIHANPSVARISNSPRSIASNSASW